MVDIKNILVPVDFSEGAPQVARMGEHIARKLGAKMTMVFVVENFSPFTGFEIPNISLDVLTNETVRSAELRMERFIQETGVDPGLVAGSAVLNGNIASEITNYAVRENTDLIVMGTHGYKGFEKMLLGSVAEKVIRTAPCPVLTVNPLSHT